MGEQGSPTSSGENVADKEGREFDEEGKQGAAERPAGSSSSGQSTGVGDSEPIDESMPDMRPGDQAG